MPTRAFLRLHKPMILGIPCLQQENTHIDQAHGVVMMKEAKSGSLYLWYHIERSRLCYWAPKEAPGVSHGGPKELASDETYNQKAQTNEISVHPPTVGTITTSRVQNNLVVGVNPVSMS